MSLFGMVLALEAGIAFATVKSVDPEISLDKRTFQTGGFPVNASLTKMMSDEQTLGGVAGFVVDPQNAQILRLSAEIEYGYYVWGGVRQAEVSLPGATVTRHFPYGLALTGAFGAANLQGSSLSDTSVSFSGSVLQMRIGSIFRYALTAQRDMGLRVGGVVFSVPAGKNRISYRSTEIGVFVEL